jgi:hypothetical protein
MRITITQNHQNEIRLDLTYKNNVKSDNKTKLQSERMKMHARTMRVQNTDKEILNAIFTNKIRT